MEDKFEKKLKELLPYIIIIGVIYLLVPALLFINTDVIAYIVMIGILPLTALLCCAHCAVKKKSDLTLAFVAPVFFLPAMFLYPIARESLLKALIYLIAYFLCGYLGLTIGEILSGKLKNKSSSDRPRPAADRRGELDINDEEPKAAPAVARRVTVQAEKVETFETEDPYSDSSLDTSTTEDDIDAILKEIHQRRS